MKHMRTPLSPIGILIGHTLPATVLLVLYWNMLSVVHPLLEPERLAGWSFYGSILGGIMLLSTLYAIILFKTGRTVHWIYSIFLVLLYAPFLYFFMDGFRHLLPWGIPRWMVPEDAELYAVRFLSVPLAHALFVLVAASLRKNERGTPLRDILIAVAIPLSCYVFVQVVEPWRWDVDFELHVWVVLFVALVLSFLFFLFRAIAALVLRKGSVSPVLGIILRTLIALVFPLLGLAINNGLANEWREVRGVFGNLSHWGFYTVAVINAAVVIWPSSNNARVRLVQFILRGIGFSYVLYFFILFLPLLPVSIVAVIAIGIGFLLLAPVMLFIVQGTLLLQDLRFLSAQRSHTSLVAMFLACIAVLPLVITGKYVHHRRVLHAALDHVYHANPSATEQDRLDTAAIAQVLHHVSANKEGRRGRDQQGNTPFLTPFYNWVVLDNLTVSERKIADLRTIFLNEFTGNTARGGWRAPDNNVLLDTATTQSTYDPAQQAWRTWVNLRMTNHTAGQSEYVTTVQLPDGAWISDEYLMIEGQRVKGILAEKKAAEWVYQHIVTVRRDPSITRYVAPGRVQVRVFPFAQDETREAGFEVLHKEAFALHIDSAVVALGDTLHPAPLAAIATPAGGTTFIPSTLKATLPLVQRTLRFHFIVDGCETQRAERERVIQRIQRFIAERGPDPSAIHVSIADAYVTHFTWNDNGPERIRTHAGDGGFFSDRAIRSIITEACAHPTNEVPVIILVPSLPADTVAGSGLWLNDLSDVAACLPEGDTFHVLGADGSITNHAFHDPAQLAKQGPAAFTQPMVRAWPDAQTPKAYLPDDGQASITTDMDQLGDLSPARERNWNDVLALEGQWRAHQLHPQGGNAAWRALVRGSFQAQVMLPVTAWMCLEDDAQRNALLKKQEEVLNADQALDTSEEEITAMSEPGIWWLLLPVALFMFVYRRRS